MLDIYLDYRRSMKQADQIREISQNLKRLSDQELSETLQELSSNWRGESSSVYLQKGELLCGNIEKTAKKFENIATAIERVAERILKAEKEAQELANIRTC